jgi:uncharacterized protein (TIGR03790 family)
MKRILGLVLCFPALHLSLVAGTPGEEAVVIYNSRLPESRAIAQDYARKRGVPPDQVLGFTLTTNGDISRAEFQDQLQRPLAKALEQRKLWHIATVTFPATNGQPARAEFRVVQSKIRYAVLCYGVPFRISRDLELKEIGTEKLRPEMRRNEAAVDSELALLPAIEESLPLHGPLRNPAYGVTNVAWLHPTNNLLLVARLDGPSPEIARGLVDKALLAETNGLWGRAYVDLRNITDPNYKPGDDWLRAAGEICRRLGFETEVDENPTTFSPGFPMDHIAFYFGWYDENVSGPFLLPQVEFMPGAFAYHLHSFSASTLRGTNRNWTGPLLAKGVTATMGCVDEPYLSGTPDMAAFVSRFLFYGFSFGEAAYASQPVLSWQTTVVGDPLYRPFGKNPDQLAAELEGRGSPLVEWVILRLLNLNLAAGKTAAEGVSLLETLDLTRNSAVLSEKLGDLYFTIGKPSSGIHAYERALTLKPSPQQSIRIRLNLAARLTTSDRTEEALTVYAKLLEEAAWYPDKLGVLNRMLPLAQKLNRTNEVQKLENEIRNFGPRAR